MSIGENVPRGNRMNVSGQIRTETREKLEHPPVVTVIVSIAGAAIDKAIANDKGYYLIRNVPRENGTIIVEVDGNEVVRQPLIASPMGNPRFDFTISRPQLPGQGKPGVVRVDSMYDRTPQNKALFQQMIAAQRANDSRRALEVLNQLLANDPKDYVSWTEAGTIYFKGGSLDDAEACYFKALSLKKDYFAALLNLGKLYLGRKSFDNAALVLANAAKVDPDSADAHHYLGESYLQIRKGNAAQFHYNEAIRLAPEAKAEVHLRLASLYDAAKMKDKAVTEYKKFLLRRPDYPQRKQLESYISDNPSK
ncbi:MAG: tetratricopeptide repeat protein [Pyrinomonadaceae bacterium]